MHKSIRVIEWGIIPTLIPFQNRRVQLKPSKHNFKWLIALTIFFCIKQFKVEILVWIISNEEIPFCQKNIYILYILKYLSKIPYYV